jgi:hypothetical protein
MQKPQYFVAFVAALLIVTGMSLEHVCLAEHHPVVKMYIDER